MENIENIINEKEYNNKGTDGLKCIRIDQELFHNQKENKYNIQLFFLIINPKAKNKSLI